MKKISIVIVLYNSDNHIYDCLDSIYLNNDIGNDLEVILVDNCSKYVDITFNNIRKKYGNNVKLVNNNKNGGYGQGNNIGIKIAKAPIILIMNPDVRLIMPIFNVVLSDFQKNNKIVMYGMKQLTQSRKRGFSFSWTVFSPTFIKILLSGLGNRLNIYYSKKMYLNGACFFIKKSFFEEIGFFDENIFLYWEENDIHQRYLRRNKKEKIIFNKKLKVIHYSESREQSIDVNVKSLQSNIYLHEKFGYSQNKALKRTLNYAIFIYLYKKISKGFSKKDFKLQKEWIDYLRRRKS